MKDNQRRNFLKGVAGMAGSVLAVSTFGRNADSTPSNRVSSVTDIKRRILGSGNDSIQVSGLGLGCMGMSYHRSYTPDPRYMKTLIRKAVDLGVNFFDTAEAYGPFTNESLVGEALLPVRKDVILCSKFGFNIQGGKLAGLNSKPAHIRSVVEQSLKRLKTDYIDLLYQH